MNCKILYQGSLSCGSIYNRVDELVYSFICSAIFDNFNQSLSPGDLVKLVTGVRSDLYRICRKLKIVSCKVIRHYIGSHIFVPDICNCVVVFYFSNGTSMIAKTWNSLIIKQYE